MQGSRCRALSILVLYVYFVRVLHHGTNRLLNLLCVSTAPESVAVLTRRKVDQHLVLQHLREVIQETLLDELVSRCDYQLVHWPIDVYRSLIENEL